MNDLIILDGAMATMLKGNYSESLVKDIHLSYIKAGSDVIYTNTFDINFIKRDFSTERFIKKNIDLAKEAAMGTNVKVALDIGPMKDFSFAKAYDVYKEIAFFAEKYAADFIVLETFTNLDEVKCALCAIKENSNLPIWVTMSFNEDGKTYLGCSVEDFSYALNDFDVDAMGINCSLGPKKILPLLKRMKCCTNKALIAKPNAGLPDKKGCYLITPIEFANAMKEAINLGASIIGGCCGTTPAFIKALSDMVRMSTGGAVTP